MTLDELTHILETYGTNAQHWPNTERDLCLQFIESSPEAQNLFNSFEKLELALSTIPQPELPGLEARVLNQALPEKQLTALDKLIAWLTPEPDSLSSLWRPATAACLPLVFGIIVGNFYSFGYDAIDDGFQYWDDELLMLSFNDYSESQP